MRAYVLTTYGSPEVLELRNVEMPTPEDDEVLIRIEAASINDWDWGLLNGTPVINRLLYGVRRPRVRIIGCDVAGRVEAVGQGVERFRPGDEVFCDLSASGFGAFAEYVCAPESALATKPANLTFEEAAGIPHAGNLALQALRDIGGIRPGQRLLINGAGGGVGTLGVQLARLHGCKVTGVDRSDKLDALLSLGFDHVIDYTSEDFTQRDERYDLIVDVKTNRPISSYTRVLQPGGIYVTVGGSMRRIAEMLLLGRWLSRTRNRSVRVLALKSNRDLDQLRQLLEEGKLQPVLDTAYEFEQLPEALARFGRGDHTGKIVVSMR